MIPHMIPTAPKLYNASRFTWYTKNEWSHFMKRDLMKINNSHVIVHAHTNIRARAHESVFTALNNYLTHI